MTLMGKVAYTLLVAFVASVLTLVAVGRLAPEEEQGGAAQAVQPSPSASLVPGGSTPSPGVTPPVATTAPGGASGITMQQVAAHSSETSCWIVIDGIVYDITSYIPRHPTDPSVLLEWCGKESTQAWEDKGGIGRPHSSRAEAALDAYEIGRLAR